MVGCNNNQPSTSNRNEDSNNSTVSNSNLNTNTNSNSNNDVGKYTVHLYLFHSSTCDHCKEEIKWLNSIEGDYSYLKIHYYEASENSELYEKVKKAMGIESDYVPLTIIGNDYFIGYDSPKGRKFIRTVNEYSQTGFCDVVEAVKVGGDIDTCMNKNKGE